MKKQNFLLNRYTKNLPITCNHRWSKVKVMNSCTFWPEHRKNLVPEFQYILTLLMLVAKILIKNTPFLKTWKWKINFTKTNLNRKLVSRIFDLSNI
ncbi:hypothetical protein BpHYR1_045438 [Brachionus plicatilis]|uniref:Uncharacterized protein n=1 Tax=Brachionus plicatilis TaxID=10195 RepID=A0A3M7PKJ3_BRAPC|nr:hypothetical protein BpHYR1_045438 [Brachionus plicatilis]